MTTPKPPAPTFTLKTIGSRLDIECEQCGDGVGASDSPFGQAVVSGFAKTHKCQPTKRKK